MFKIMRTRDLFNQYLQTEEPMAKTIRQGMREKKMPKMAECITDKTDKDGKRSKQ